MNAPRHEHRAKSSAQDRDRIRLACAFWDGLKSLGVAPSAVLHRANMPAALYSGESMATTAQYFAIWRAVRELVGDPTVGWKFVNGLESSQFHPTLLAALHARTFRDSIERLARYKRLCCSQEFHLIPAADGEVRVEVAFPLLAGEPVPELLTDSAFALVMELGRRGTKTPLRARRVELIRPAEPGNSFEDYFGCPVLYGAARDGLILPACDLELPYLTHNEELLHMLSSQFEHQLESEAQKPGILAQVRWVLKRLLAGSRPDLVMVARELGMSDRTLQRRITDAGSTFRRLLSETRHELARQYLGDESNEIVEAAFLVGFEDPNSFYRAFRSWEGTTPAEWRAARRNTSASSLQPIVKVS
ncbi:AraC family transcriptional regulator [Verrucomicrobia bacterium LW23]|nr:AraC family transcriptional regulator [Verrucomicrobia bacterium LW23]